MLNKSTGQTVKLTSKGNGEYQAQQLQPATYDITVSMTGFGSQTVHAELLVNQPATIDFSLPLQATDVVVNVTETADTLNRTDASIGNSSNDPGAAERDAKHS